MNDELCKLGLAVIEAEASAIANLSSRIDDSFAKACEILLNCQGRIIVMGMGKSGHIANKIAATLASTGSPAFFVHPGEACHGDFGMVTKSDVIIALSNSGESQEIITLLPLIKRLGIPLISLTGNKTSPLATASNIVIDVSVEVEACPLGLAPTTSTTACLVMGDALAVALLQTKGFAAEDFALSHPGGSLGRKLLLRVDSLCHKDDALPLVSESATISDALIEVSEKKLGMTCVSASNGQLVGVFTDGDVRRALTRNVDIHTTLVGQVMSKGNHVIPFGMLAAEALEIMEAHQITSLIVTDDTKRPKGVVHIHDLVKAGVV